MYALNLHLQERVSIVLRKENIQYALKLHMQERISVEEGEHRVCLKFAPAGTYINCAEE